MKRRITHIAENFHYWNSNGWTGWFSRITRTSDGATFVLSDEPDCNVEHALCKMTGKRWFSEFGKSINIELKSREWQRLYKVLKPEYAGNDLPKAIRAGLRKSARDANPDRCKHQGCHVPTTRNGSCGNHESDRPHKEAS